VKTDRNVTWKVPTKADGKRRTEFSWHRVWAGEATFVDQWWATRTQWHLSTHASIERWVDLVNHLEPLRRSGMASARSDIFVGAIAAAALAFDRGIAQASVAERFEASAPVRLLLDNYGDLITQILCAI